MSTYKNCTSFALQQSILNRERPFGYRDVGRLFVKAQHLFNMAEHIPRKNRKNVGGTLVVNINVSYIRSCIWVRNHVNGRHVGRALVLLHILFNIRELTLLRKV